MLQKKQAKAAMFAHVLCVWGGSKSACLVYFVVVIALL
jgi:hypothetical protein